VRLASAAGAGRITGMRTLLLLATAVLAGGCAAEMMMLGPAPVVTLAIEPGDGATAWGGRDMVVTVTDTGRLLNPEGRADLPNHFYVHTWPEGTPVPITTDEVASPNEAQWAIRVTPALTLDDRWYVVGASDLSPRILSNVKLPDGTIGARFAPGSHPRVANVQFCEGAPKGDEGTAPSMKLVLGFSEPVTPPADPLAAIAVAAGGQPVRCESYGADAGALYFTCEGLSLATPVTLSVADGIATPAGVALEAASWSIDLAKLPAGSCRTFAPPID
jgi:hypothetical protein